MKLSDFIRILKTSFLLDLGMYLIALARQNFHFSSEDFRNLFNMYPVILIFCVFIFYLKRL